MKKNNKMTGLVLSLSLAMVLGSCGGQSTSESSSGGSDSASENSTSVSTSSAGEKVIIGGVRKKKSFETYENNKKEKENKKTEFYDRTQTYKVGSMNRFNVLPIVTFLNEIGTLISVPSWEYDIKIERKIEVSTYETLNNVTSEYLDSVNTSTCDIDFSEMAEGQTFKVTVTPTGLEADQIATIQLYQTTIEFEVVEGYNVYNSIDLAYLNTQKNNKYATAWDTFKQEHNVDTTITPTKFYFHDDIKVTKDSLPSIYFYNEGDSDLSSSDSDYNITLGSLRDTEYPYQIDYSDDYEEESYSIVGNYFSLDSSQLPLVTRPDGNQPVVNPDGTIQGIVPHAALFNNNVGDYDESVGDERQANKHYEMRDINFLGNAPRVEDASKSGGIILMKSEVETKWINCIATSWYITFMNKKAQAPQLIEDCKAYDNFNCFIYNYGGIDLKIDHCDMNSAGGPIIIQDHVDPDDPADIASSTKITNSNLENYVAGTEGWFNIFNATAYVDQIKAMNGLFATYGKSYLTTKPTTGKQTFFNLICVNKSGKSAAITTDTKVKGRLAIDDNPYFDYGNYDSNSNPYLNGFIRTVLGVSTAAPIFQSCNTNGFAYFNGSALVDATASAVSDANHPIFEGDYLNLYFQGMFLTFGYFDYQAPAIS